MRSLKLPNAFLLSAITFIFHGIEEYFTGFYLVDKSYLLTVERLGTDPAATFIAYQVFLWGILFAGYDLVRKGKWGKPITLTLVIIMMLELQHVYETVVTGKYYPGLYTAALFPFVAFLLYLAFQNSHRVFTNHWRKRMMTPASTGWWIK